MLKSQILLRLIAFHIGVSVSLLLPAVLLGQDTLKRLEIQADAGQPQATSTVSLRPNTATSLALTLQNPGEEEMRNVVVKLVQAGPGDEVRVLGQTLEVEKLPAKGKVRLAFAKGKDKKEKKEKDAPDAKEKKDKEAPDPLELTGPPFRVQLWIESRQSATIKTDVQFVLREPRDYLTAQGQYDQAKRKVSFKVKYGDPANVTGPDKCPLQLVLGPEFEPNKKGAFMQPLTDPKQGVDLFAEELAFSGFKVESGHIYLTADGYERAFTYSVSLAGSGHLDEIPLGQKIGARIRTPRYTKPTEKLPVVLEMDGPTSADYRVELGLDRAGTKGEFEFRQFNGLRQQKIVLGFSEAGDLVCNTTMREWQTEFDTSGVFGDMIFRLSVYKKNELVALLDPREAGWNQTGQETSADGKRLFARVTQDDTPPREVEFVNLPKAWYVGRLLPVHVRVRLPRANQAPIEKRLIFFRGKPSPDGKINPETILGYGEFDPAAGACHAVLPAFEKAEPLEMSVQVTTAAGVPSVKTVSLVIREAKVAPATIKGIVAHGGNGQPNVTVGLADEKGKTLTTVKSGAKGEFVFKNVLPGNYFVFATTSVPALVGSSKVEVPEGQEVVDNVTLRLLAK